MERPKRKPTRMSWYDYSTVGFYFITICTKDKQKLLGEVVGAGAFDGPQASTAPVGAGAFDGPHMQLSKYGKVVEKYIRSTNRIPGVRVENYVVMPNHIHMIVSVEEIDGPSRASAPTPGGCADAETEAAAIPVTMAANSGPSRAPAPTPGGNADAETADAAIPVTMAANSGPSRAPAPTNDGNADPHQTTRQNERIPHVVSTLKRFCNREIGEDVFQRSYHDRVIRGQKELEKIWSYIDDNPRRWKEDRFYC